MTETPNILKDYESQISQYPQAEYFTILQQKNFWFADEVNVEKDIQYVLTELDENSKHGILETLKLFTIYETKVDCFWGEVVKNMFPDPEIKTMATYFSGIELGIHRIAYNKLNKLLNLYNDEFYNSYKQSNYLVERINFLDKYTVAGSNLEQLAVLCLAEGVVLFSNFAFLMSFRANGFNLLPNVGNVIKFSAKDEDLHCKASSWLFTTLRKEMLDLNISDDDIEDKIHEMAKIIQEHEFKIIESIFSRGSIPTIKKEDLQNFILSRIDVCLVRMGFKPIHNVKDCKVSAWFDKIIGNTQNNDFFAGQGASYSRGFIQDNFKWNNK